MDSLGGEVLSSWKQSIWIPRASINTFHCVKHNQHANARGSGGRSPRKILKNRCSEIEFEAILKSKYMHVI